MEIFLDEKASDEYNGNDVLSEDMPATYFRKVNGRENLNKEVSSP